MRIGEVELKGIPEGENIRCHAQHRGPAVAYFNGNACCAECFGAELLFGDNNRELIGYLLAGLIKETK
jgi:hypothetical protein